MWYRKTYQTLLSSTRTLADPYKMAIEDTPQLKHDDYPNIKYWHKTQWQKESIHESNLKQTSQFRRDTHPRPRPRTLPCGFSRWRMVPSFSTKPKRLSAPISRLSGQTYAMEIVSWSGDHEGKYPQGTNYNTTLGSRLSTPFSNYARTTTRLNQSHPETTLIGTTLG